MNPEELAAVLDGRQYRNEITKEEEELAKKHRLVVVFGASDDLVEFRGFIRDECGAPGEVLLCEDGILSDNYFEEVESLAEVNALQLRFTGQLFRFDSLWLDDHTGIPWTYNTYFPASRFEVLEDDEVYCVGFVFHLPEDNSNAGICRRNGWHVGTKLKANIHGNDSTVVITAVGREKVLATRLDFFYERELLVGYERWHE